MVAAAVFQHRALDHAGLGEHQRDCARFVAGSELLRLGQPAPGGAACVEHKTMNGNVIQHTLVGTANKAMQDMVRYAVEFGMTPSARSRVNASPDGKEEDAYKEFFG